MNKNKITKKKKFMTIYSFVTTGQCILFSVVLNPPPTSHHLSYLSELIATLPPFGPIEGHKWFFQISSQWESQEDQFAFISFGKIQFLPPCIWYLPYRLCSLNYHCIAGAGLHIHMIWEVSWEPKRRRASANPLWFVRCTHTVYYRYTVQYLY